MRLRRSAVRTCVAALAATFALAQIALVDGCGAFVAESNDAPPGPADAVSGPDDGAAGDALAPADAGDAGDAATADASCAHTFCADFEEPDPAAGWTEAKTGGGGTLGIGAGTGTSGNALTSMLPAVVASASAYAYVSQAFVGATELHVELDINAPVVGAATGGDVNILELSGISQAGLVSGVGVLLKSTLPSLSFFIAHGDGSSDGPTALIDLPRGMWTHVTLHFQFGESGSLQVLVGGSVAIAQSVITQVVATPALRVGLQHYNAATSAMSARFDSVRVDVVK